MSVILAIVELLLDDPADKLTNQRRNAILFNLLPEVVLVNLLSRLCTARDLLSLDFQMPTPVSLQVRNVCVLSWDLLVATKVTKLLSSVLLRRRSSQHTDRRQTTKRATSIAVGRICAVHALRLKTKAWFCRPESDQTLFLRSTLLGADTAACMQKADETAASLVARRIVQCT